MLGYAFGGNVKHLMLAVVDQDHGVPAIRMRELAGAVSSGAATVDLVEYADPGQALADLRNGRVNGVLTIPPDFSRRTLARQAPRVALISDNTDTFVSATMAATVNGLVAAFNAPATAARVPAGRRWTSSRCIPTFPTSSTCCRARSPCRSS